MDKNVNKTVFAKLIVLVRQWVKYQFNLEHNAIHEPAIIENVYKSVEFRGYNLWILIFAILIASIGLNINSTAVVIGAMLISPLMGPVTGIGLGVGVNDFQLIKKSFRNLGIATAISLATSAIYFSLTPLNDARSELLARTTPSIWDVFIAFFGGLTGMIAFMKREKGNIISGVAIATALMPPLCTAGYAISSGNISFFIGAFYLYFINSVFIAIATYLMVRYQKFAPRSFINPQVEKKVRRSIAIVIIITMGPSIFMAYRIVSKSIYERNAISFVDHEFDFTTTQIVSKKVDADSRTIEVLLFGEKIDEETMASIRHRMPFYNLTKTNLEIRQNIEKSAEIDYNAIKTGVLEDLYKKNEVLVRDGRRQIDSLQQKIKEMQYDIWPVKGMSEELSSMVGEVAYLSMSPAIFYVAKDEKYDTLLTVYIKMEKRPSQRLSKKIREWIKARTQKDSVRIFLN